VACPRIGVGADAMATTVYPNPARENVTVQFNSTTESNYTIQLTDITGRVVYAYSGDAQIGLNSREINLSEVQSGVYLVKIKSAGYNETTRLVIE
jgi:Tfp pilus assembly ATPase PilU